jgi:hypothetical protein
MGRQRTPIGTFGEISYVRAGRKVRTRTRYRDDDGRIRRVQASGTTEADAARRLAQRQSRRSYGELSPDSSFTALVKVWLEDLDLVGCPRRNRPARASVQRASAPAELVEKRSTLTRRALGGVRRWLTFARARPRSTTRPSCRASGRGWGENATRPEDRPDLIARLLEHDLERVCAMVLDDNDIGQSFWSSAGIPTADRVEPLWRMYTANFPRVTVAEARTRHEPTKITTQTTIAERR